MTKYLILIVLMPRVLNSEVVKTESKGDYISISIKEPASQSASAADSSSGSSSK